MKKTTHGRVRGAFVCRSMLPHLGGGGVIIVEYATGLNRLQLHVQVLLEISLLADGPQRCHPTHGHEGSSRLSRIHALRLLIAMQVQHSYNSSTNGSSFTYSRTNDFRYGRQNKNLALTRIELTTPALAGVRGYLLYHSGEEGIITGF